MGNYSIGFQFNAKHWLNLGVNRPKITKVVPISPIHTMSIGITSHAKKLCDTTPQPCLLDHASRTARAGLINLKLQTNHQASEITLTHPTRVASASLQGLFGAGVTAVNDKIERR